MFTLALVGRPNVGKSTLFNRFAGKQLAIVDDTPGVTRDWRESEGQLFDRTIRIIDTAGLEESFDDSIEARMRKQTEAGLEQADAMLFIIDGRTGVTSMDEHFAGVLRRQNKPIILCVNKAENDKAVQTTMGDAYSLGLGAPVAISAEHNIGMEDIYDALTPHFPEDEVEIEELHDEEDEFANIDDIEGLEEFEFEQDEEDEEKALKIAIIGRPNVGKSTLLNAILEEERVMTGPEAGITRDAIAVDWEYTDSKGNSRPMRLVDTAGMRKRARVQDNIEKMSVEDSMRAIRLAQVVVLVIDANMVLEKQDLQIAEHVINEGRAMIIAVNKWDIVDDRTDTLEEVKHRLSSSLAQIKDIPFVTISAKNGKHINRLLNGIVDIYKTWNIRIPTGQMNRWLRAMESRNPAPLISGRQNRLKYIAQIKTRPPTFAIWVSVPKKLPPAYRRYIINGLRRDYDMPGVPIRLLVRTSKNPYKDKTTTKG